MCSKWGDGTIPHLPPPPPHPQYTSEIHDYYSEPNVHCSKENAEATCPENMVSFRVLWNKHSYDVTLSANETVGNLKKHIETLTGQEMYQN